MQCLPETGQVELLNAGEDGTPTNFIEGMGVRSLDAGVTLGVATDAALAPLSPVLGDGDFQRGEVVAGVNIHSRAARSVLLEKAARPAFDMGGNRESTSRRDFLEDVDGISGGLVGRVAPLVVAETDTVKESTQRRQIRGDIEQRQDVAAGGRQLDTGEDGQPSAFSGPPDVVDGFDSVVIGDADRLDAGAPGGIDDLLGCHRTIAVALGARGVDVQVYLSEGNYCFVTHPADRGIPERNRSFPRNY